MELRNNNLIEFKWGTSKGTNSYGFNICSMYLNGEKLASNTGVGYDMKGTCLAEFIKKNFKDTLKTLKGNEYYGLSFYDPREKTYKDTYSDGCEIYLNGSAGFNAMEKVLNTCGYKLSYIYEGHYLLEKIN